MVAVRLHEVGGDRKSDEGDAENEDLRSERGTEDAADEGEANAYEDELPRVAGAGVDHSRVERALRATWSLGKLVYAPLAQRLFKLALNPIGQRRYLGHLCSFEHDSPLAASIIRCGGAQDNTPGERQVEFERGLL